MQTCKLLKKVQRFSKRTQ